MIVSGSIVELYEYAFPFMYDTVGRVGISSDSVSTERRVDNLRYVRQEIRRVIECNYKNYGYEPIFLTLTFKENLQQVDLANREFKKFIQRLNNYYGRSFKYLAITEFQRRGAVHYHSIFFNMPLEIESQERRNRTVSKIWGNGFIDIERVRHAKAVAPYVSKYLEKSIMDKRLIGKKAYFTSRGLLRPKEIRNEAEINKKFSEYNLALKFESVYSSEHYKTIIYKQYVRT